MRVFHYVIKKRRRALTPDSFFFFNDSDIFLKYFNSNQNLSSYSLFSKCFSWFFYLGVHRGTGVFCCLFFFAPPLARDSLSRSPRPCLRLTEKSWKNCAFSADLDLLNETKSSCFPLSCLSSYQNGW